MAKKVWKYTKNSTPGSAQNAGNEAAHAPRIVFLANGTTVAAGQRIGEACDGVDSSTLHDPLSLQTNVPLPLTAPPSGGGQEVGNQVTDHPWSPWSGTEASNFQLDFDWALHDMFDFAMPNVFRDPLAWQYLQMANDEENNATGPDYGYANTCV